MEAVGLCGYFQGSSTGVGMERGVQRTCVVIHVSAMIYINKDALHHLRIQTCIFRTASVTTRSKLEQRDGVLWPGWSFWIARIWRSKIT